MLRKKYLDFAIGLLFAIGTQGCSATKNDVSGLQQKANVDRLKKVKQDTDRLWREGYGFNNPNPERIRKGLPTVGFNGKEKNLLK